MKTIIKPTEQQYKLAQEKASKRYKEADALDKGRVEGFYLKNQRKLYGLFRYNEEGKLVGYVEYSFSMGWSTERVSVMTKAEAALFTTRNKSLVNGEAYRDTFLVRLSSNKTVEKYGLKFDRKLWIQDIKNYPKSKKFDRRNIKFEVVSR